MKLNGNLVLNANGASEVQNMIIERVSTLPAVLTTEAGRLVYNTTLKNYWYNTGLAWSALATGGNATALQNEVDAIEASLGAFINSADGTFNATAFSTFSNVANATSVANVLYQLDQAIIAQDELAELHDVHLTSPTDNQVLYFDGVTNKWVNETLVLTDIPSITATTAEVNELHTSGVVTADLAKLHAVTSTAAELNILTGATLTVTELNYVTGVTSAIQTQLNDKQPLDAQLTSISLPVNVPNLGDILVGTGIAGGYHLLTGAGFRSIEGLVIGTNIQAWDADLDTLAAFAPAIKSTEIITINGDTVTHTGITDFMVATGTQTEGARWTLERGAAVRTSLGLGDIAILDESSFVRADATGSSNIAANINFNNYRLVGLAPGVDATDAVNIAQLESAITGLTWKHSVHAATTANIALTGAPTIDDVILSAGMRVLVKNQTLPATNGIYVVTATGAWTLATDFDILAEQNGAAVYVEDGTIQGGSGWVITTDILVLGADPVVWTQFNGASGVTAGIGLLKTGNILSVQLGAGIAELPSAEVGIDVYSSSGALILTTTGSNRSTDAAAQLHLLLDLTGNGKLIQSVDGLKVTTNTITESELTASVAGAGLIGGNGTPLAVVTAAGTPAIGGDTTANWTGIGTITVTADYVGVDLGHTATTAAPGNHSHTAAAITFDNTGTGGSATNVQAELVILDGRVDTLETNAGDLLTEVNAVEAAAGLNTDGTLVPFVRTHYLDSATTLAAGEIALDTAIETLDTQINNKVNKMYYLYTGAASTSHSVSHNLGQKYCNVTIVDATDEVVIPQSITFNDTNTLVVTFNVAVAVSVVVMGLA